MTAVGLLVLAACGGSDDSSDTDTTGAASEPIEPTGGPVSDVDTTAVGTDPTGTTASTTGEAGVSTPVSEVITLVAYESFPTEGTPVNDRLAEFTSDTGIGVDILIAGDTGTMLSKAELTAGNPEGDVMWGIDNTFLSRAIDSDIFETYAANGLDVIPSKFTDLVPNDEATPVDFGDVCVNYDIAGLADRGVDPPTSLDELADPAYADLLVVENPASSSPGLAFLLATIDEYGSDGWQDYWMKLVDNGVQVVDGWTQAYNTTFSYAGGDRPLVVSYGSSPPFEVLYSDEALDAAPTGVIESTCYRQVEFVGVLAGTDQPDAAHMLVDYMIGEDFQATLPLDLFVFPVDPDVELDPAFQDYAVIPDDSRSIAPDEIDANREAWIDEWTDLVLG